MLLDAYFEIIKETDLDKVNKLLQTYESAGRNYNMYVYELITCVVDPEINKLVYILGRKLTHPDYS